MKAVGQKKKKNEVWGRAASYNNNSNPRPISRAISIIFLSTFLSSTTRADKQQRTFI